jgi:tRNA wybutosine-synthesizing protein 2
VYPPLLLLPATTFTSPEWKHYLSSIPTDDLYSIFTSTFNCTHMALSAPIQLDPLRSPHITPLVGYFSDLWVTTTQNGIKQTWAPLHTMFSRGNITEKARVLGFRDVRGEQVADLFVGIGYFAFSYLSAGAKRVWGWDLNSWSVQGLIRGTPLNGWKCVTGGDPREEDSAQVVVFNEDNVHAAERLRSRGIRVRHVNLGLLPSSEIAWGVAGEILDEKGGWIHVHGNCRDGEIGEWEDRVAQAFRGIFGGRREVRVADRFRVKEFGPGVGHYVLDLACSAQSH